MLITAVLTSSAAMVGMVVTAAITVYHRGQNDGRLTEILASLQAITRDHEDRIRRLEKPES